MGTPQRGSGRVKGAPEWVRSEPVKVLLRPSERDDLESIARAWGVPVGTVAWVLVHESLARQRGEAPNYGERVGLALVTARRVLEGYARRELELEAPASS